MKNLNGWQVVALVAILCGTLIALVWQGQSVGAIVAAGVVVASALGINVATNLAQNSVNSEKLGQVKDLANGQNQTLQRQLETERAVHAGERAFLMNQVKEANDRAVQFAAMITPDKAPEVTNAPRPDDSSDTIAFGLQQPVPYSGQDH